jgi:hypothetical protein
MSLINYTKQFGYAQEYRNRIEGARAQKTIDKSESKRDDALFKAEGREINGHRRAAMRAYRKADVHQRQIDNLRERHAGYLSGDRKLAKEVDD